MGRDLRIWTGGRDGHSNAGQNQPGVGDSAWVAPGRELLAEREDRSEPTGLARHYTHQSARNGQFADAAFLLRIAGRGGDADVSKSTFSRQAEPFNQRVRGLLECAEHFDVS